MLDQIRRHVSYANVMATVGVFIALGGVGYAAVTLPKDSVSSGQVKNSSLTGADVKNSSLTGSDIKNKSLTPADFSGSVQGPAGAQGAQGPKGDSGAKGDTGPAGPLLDALPSGKTLRGVYDVFGTATAASQPFTDVHSFAFPLAADLTSVKFIASGAAVPAECAGGTIEQPKANPGVLCVFEGNKVNSTFRYITNPISSTAGEASRYGFAIWNNSVAAGTVVSRGSWAVTAP